jgi:hypothetical protein
MRLILLALTVIVSVADVLAADAPPLHSRPYSVKCAPSVNVWIEVDGASIQTREQVKTETKKRVSFGLIGSMPYRGDAVLCNYGSRRRDVAASYSIRCVQPRKERGYPHTYFCSGK